MRRKRKDDELDTETTFADMNVEGMRWYNPHRKDKDKQEKISKKEQRKMMLGAFAAFAPVIGIIIVVGLLMFLLAYIWLKP
ncbi:MAG: hypothetical protein LUD27_05460 [Clostridia bacterium]|nr:hypothetical protein [Clostridia bacterium]